MKKQPYLLYVFLCVLAASCTNHDKNTGISYRSSDHHYSMKAYYDKSKTAAVDAYLYRQMGKKSNVLFVDIDVDRPVTLDDRTVFYMEKSPGILNIKLDKRKNTEEAYEQIRSMCEGLKEVITGP